MNPLALSDIEYRQVYERITELALAYLKAVPDLPTFPQVGGAETQKLFGGPLPEQAMGGAALDGLSEVVECVRPTTPRFFGYVLGSGEPVAAAADLLASVLNQNVTAWRSAPSGATIERTVVGWLGQMIGCRGYAGTLAGGGSTANLAGLAMARESRLPANEAGVRKAGAVYASTEVHMSIGKAVALLGIGREQLRLIPCDDRFRMRPDLLQQAMERDATAGITPIAIVGSAGTVNTGAIDPLDELAAIAQHHGAWFHIDGAYGALAALALPEEFAGIDRADSVSLDPHKWLYQPLDCGCLLYQSNEAAQRAFSHTGAYAESYLEDPIENFMFFEETIELSRRFRALKLWLSLRYHGVKNFREAIQNDIDCARYFSQCVDAEPELERLAPGPLSAVCFRYVPNKVTGELSLNELNQRILRDVVRHGRVYLSNATLHNQFALRICVVNHRSTHADLDEVIAEVIAAGRQISSGTTG